MLVSIPQNTIFLSEKKCLGEFLLTTSHPDQAAPPLVQGGFTLPQAPICYVCLYVTAPSAPAL